MLLEASSFNAFRLYHWLKYVDSKRIKKVERLLLIQGATYSVLNKLPLIHLLKNHSTNKFK